MSGEDALRERPLLRVIRSSSSFFTPPGKIAGNGHNLASPLYFCKVSLDGGGTGDTALGELGKYEEGRSGEDRLDQIIAYHTRGLIYLCPSWKHLSSSHHSPCLY